VPNGYDPRPWVSVCDTHLLPDEARDGAVVRAEDVLRDGVPHSPLDARSKWSELAITFDHEVHGWIGPHDNHTFSFAVKPGVALWPKTAPPMARGQGLFVCSPSGAVQSWTMSFQRIDPDGVVYGSGFGLKFKSLAACQG
jgi:hypothetical protein